MTCEQKAGPFETAEDLGEVLLAGDAHGFSNRRAGFVFIPQAGGRNRAARVRAKKSSGRLHGDGVGFLIESCVFGQRESSGGLAKALSFAHTDNGIVADFPVQGSTRNS